MVYSLVCASSWFHRWCWCYFSRVTFAVPGQITDMAKALFRSQVINPLGTMGPVFLQTFTPLALAVVSADHVMQKLLNVLHTVLRLTSTLHFVLLSVPNSIQLQRQRLCRWSRLILMLRGTCRKYCWWHGPPSFYGLHKSEFVLETNTPIWNALNSIPNRWTRSPIEHSMLIRSWLWKKFKSSLMMP